MKKLWLLGVVVAAGSFAAGCGKSEADKAIENAAKQIEASQAKQDEILKDAKDMMNTVKEDAVKKIDQAGKDAAEAFDKAKAEGDKKAAEIKDAASDTVNKALEGVKK